MSRGGGKPNSSRVQAALPLETTKLELGLPPGLSEPQELPASEASHGEKEELKEI